jgi:hypothetical protein
VPAKPAPELVLSYSWHGDVLAQDVPGLTPASARDGLPDVTNSEPTARHAIVKMSANRMRVGTEVITGVLLKENERVRLRLSQVR